LVELVVALVELEAALEEVEVVPVELEVAPVELEAGRGPHQEADEQRVGRAQSSQTGILEDSQVPQL